MSAAAALAAACRLPALLKGAHEHDAGRDQEDANETAGCCMLLLEADPAELVDEHRREGLPEDDRRGQRHGPQLRRRDDRARHVEGAEQPADPDPPRDIAQPRERRERPADERRDDEQRDRAHEERDERRPDRAAEPVRELRVHAELNGSIAPAATAKSR